MPVDFTLNTEVAVAKTLELMDKEQCTIHLLHVMHSSLFADRSTFSTCEKKLREWKASISVLDEAITVDYRIVKSGSVQKAIRQLACEVGADLIVIGQTAPHNWLALLKAVHPMRLNELTGIPVLTVKPGALHNKTKTIVVPITDQMSTMKKHTLEILCKKGKPTIHLITLSNDNNVPSEFSASALLQAYQWLKTVHHCPVEYAVVHGPNKAKAILQYAEKTNADILLVHPDKETRVGWGGTHISDVLPSFSRVQILAVQPA